MSTRDLKSLANQIELFLLSSGGWVPTWMICKRYSISDRQLRSDHDKPGILDRFAVSSTRQRESGYIHHSHLPTAEWLPIKHRLIRHALSELRRVRHWSNGRQNCLTGSRSDLHERHTGQAVMATI